MTGRIFKHVRYHKLVDSPPRVVWLEVDGDEVSGMGGMGNHGSINHGHQGLGPGAGAGAGPGAGPGPGPSPTSWRWRVTLAKGPSAK